MGNSVDKAAEKQYESAALEIEDLKTQLKVERTIREAECSYKERALKQMEEVKARLAVTDRAAKKSVKAGLYLTSSKCLYLS